MASSSVLAGLRRVALGRYTGVLVGLILVTVYFGATQSAFFTWDNFENIVASNSVVLILAVGATLVVISGGIDLSAASATVACGMVVGLALQAGWAFVAVLAVGLGFGLFLGLINGGLIAWLKIPFLVVTLGTLSVYASFALVVQDGVTINVFQFPGFDPLRGLVNDNLGPIPLLMVMDLALLLAAGAVLRYTTFGRSLYAIGSNTEAARLAGIRVGAVLVGVYALAGFCAGLASLVLVGRLTAAAPTVDPSLLLTVLAAVLIGGTAYTGGEGGVFGTLIGVLFLGVVQNGLTLSEVSAFWQGTVSGTILILSVGIGVLRDRGIQARMARNVVRRSPRSSSPGEAPPPPGEPEPATRTRGDAS